MLSKMHHAVVIDGEGAGALVEARVYIRDVLLLTEKENPDVLFTEYDRFGIEEARSLKERAYQVPLGDRQVFVVTSLHLTREAQNGLLKLFEEPPRNTHFIFILPSIEVLLPTVRSRILHLHTSTGGVLDVLGAQEFCNAPFTERMAIVSGIVESKDRARARTFLNALEAHLVSLGIARYSTPLKEVALAQEYVGDTSSSLKMLLEHVILTLDSHSPSTHG
jgi:hypothetical protein